MTFFTETNRQRAKEIVARYPRAKSAILPLAHLAQDQHGWLNNEAIDEIADLTHVTSAEVQGTCSFYTMFKRRPCGKLVVSVCTNVTCLVTGGPEILAHLEDHFATDPEVTVEEVECLAACGGAPSMQVNYEFHERLTRESAQRVVEEYRSGVRQPRTTSGSTA
ncbi:MAG TPA: NAD(P)H-dependent oxidoreductase subunit E [Acidimicrobiia bacterium]|jgi:NADH-quinone oxidoreductase subunit E|nr:NAD(P)H-dependent oxidoreductase subunit E [Acidimicrobiia bacterium]